MDHQVHTLSDPDALAAEAARFVAERAIAAVATRGRFTVAVSGGKTPWAMLAELARAEVPWGSVDMFQVDERVVALGDPNRNLTHLRQCLARVPARLRPMPVDEPDLDAAAQDYAEQLPERFDLVHLGLGPDGHTASLVPGDPDLETVDRLVAISQPYQGHRRMTLTYPALERADEILWLISGEEKRDALTRLLVGDTSIPAGRVQAGHSTVLADAAAAPG